VFILFGFFQALFGQLFIQALSERLGSTTKIGDFPLPDSNSPFYFYFVLALCFAAGLSVAVFLWSPRPGYWRRFLIYVLLLGIMLPISGFNYVHADYLLNRGAQSLFNIVLVFCGSVIVSELMRLRASARDLLVLQVLAVFALTLTAVIIPGMFSIVWLLNTLKIVPKDQPGSAIISPAVITICGVTSAAIAYLKFRHETKN